MLLAVDIGNTQTSFGIYSGDYLIHHWRADTRLAMSPDALAAFLYPLLTVTELNFSSIHDVAVCSVVPSVERVFDEFWDSYVQQARVIGIGANSLLGFHINVENADEVGADRLANAEYAVAHLALPSIVVDFGTATTFDLVIPSASKPSYEGGVILPGVGIALEALSTKTAKLSSVSLRFPPSVIGRNTVQCIQSGLLYGYVDMVDGLLDRFQNKLGTPPNVVFTGGLAALFQDQLKHQVKLVSDLTLEGIRLIHSRNRI